MTSAQLTMRRSWWIIGVVFVQWLIGYFDKTAMSVLAVPVAAEFGFSKSQMGLVLSGFFLGFAAMTPIGGYLADRFGARRVLFLVMLLWSIFTGLTTLAWSLASLIVLRALFGLAEGSFPSASSAAVAALMPVHQRGRAKALLTSGATLGTAFGALIVSALAASHGWRYPFHVFAAIGIAVSFAFLLISRGMAPQQSRTQPLSLREALRVVGRFRLVWALAATQFGVGFFAWGLNQWLPSYWVQVKGLSLTSAGLVTAIPNVVAFFAMLGAGFLSDKVSGKEGKFICVALIVTLIATCLTYFASSVAMGVFYVGVAQVAISTSAPLLAIVVLKRMHTSVAGTATGLTNFGQQMAGVIAPTVMGCAIDAAGGAYGVIFALVVIILAVSAVVSLTIDGAPAHDIRDNAQHTGG